MMAYTLPMLAVITIVVILLWALWRFLIAKVNEVCALDPAYTYGQGPIEIDPNEVDDAFRRGKRNSDIAIPKFPH